MLKKVDKVDACLCWGGKLSQTFGNKTSALPFQQCDKCFAL